MGKSASKQEAIKKHQEQVKNQKGGGSGGYGGGDAKGIGGHGGAPLQHPASTKQPADPAKLREDIKRAVALDDSSPKKFISLLNAVICAKDSACECDELGSAEEALKPMLSERLTEGIANMDEKNLWKTWSHLCRIMKNCQKAGYTDLEAYKAAETRAKELELSIDTTMDLSKDDMGASAVAFFQRLCDEARNPDFDKLVENPKFIVDKVTWVHHERTRAEYLLKRERLIEEIEKGDKPQKFEVASQKLDFSEVIPFDQGHEHQLRPDLNEFYVFHGTSAEVVGLITDSDFLIKTSADHGWTFGPGVYTAEYISHAQFFSQQVGGQEGQAAILVCRAFCGRIYDIGEWPNTTEPDPRQEGAIESIKARNHDSTSGCEWPDVPGMREFILPDDDQVMPEFIIYGHSPPQDEN